MYLSRISFSSVFIIPVNNKSEIDETVSRLAGPIYWVGVTLDELNQK